MNYIPAVSIQGFEGSKSYDLFSLLLKERIIFISGEINDDLANIALSEILYLSAVSKKEKITIYINSPGGSVTSGLAIYDAMKNSQCIIETIGVGLCASMGAFLLSSGSKGHRFSYPNCEIMIHQPLGAFEGQVTDMDIMNRRYLYLKEKLITLLSDHTGQRKEKIKQDTERNYFMTAAEAKNYGLIDEILQN